MKKTVFLIFLLIFFFLSSQTSLAKSDPTPVEYQLPYPGLLPDSPLYFLKAIRDKISGFLISDPLNKAEFDLLQADKRLNAGVYLLNKKKAKEGLAQSTISKGENYFEEALGKVREAKKQGMNTEPALRKLSLAAKKHQEVLKNLENKAPRNLKKSFSELRKRVADFEKQVNLLLPS